MVQRIRLFLIAGSSKYSNVLWRCWSASRVRDNMVKFNLIVRHILSTFLTNLSVPSHDLKHYGSRNITTDFAFITGFGHGLCRKKYRTDMTENATSKF